MKALLILFIVWGGDPIASTETPYISMAACNSALERMRIDVGDSGTNGWAVVAYCNPNESLRT